MAQYRVREVTVVLEDGQTLHLDAEVDLGNLSVIRSSTNKQPSARVEISMPVQAERSKTTGATTTPTVPLR